MDSTSSSSEQSETRQPSEKPRGPVAYGFQPVCEPRSERVETSSPGSSSPLLWDSDSSASLDLEDEDVSRLNNVAWCVCGHCIPMTTHIESVCCREITAVQHRIPDRACLTDHDDFAVVCTNRAVLEVGLMSMCDLRADSLVRPIASR